MYSTGKLGPVMREALHWEQRTAWEAVCVYLIAVMLCHSLYVISGEVGSSTTTQGEATDKLHEEREGKERR